MATAICNGITNFSYKLLEQLSKNEGNLLFSPMSAHAVLSMVYPGSAGPTASNLEKVLGLAGAKKAAEGYENFMETLSFLYSVKLYIVNKVYAQSPLKQDFTAIATKSFFSEAETINLSDKDDAAGKINSWVEEKTESRVKDIVSPSDLAGSPLVLVNTINLKGDWMIQFEEGCTQKKKFYVSETNAVDCDMMTSHMRLKYGEDLDLEAQVFIMAYENESIHLMIFLPRMRMGIKSLEEKIQTKTIPKILQNMDPADILLTLPKCRIETKTNFQGPLSELGLGVLFDQAEFPNMLDSKGALKGVKLIQKTVFEMTDQGTDLGEAAFVFSRQTSVGQRVQYREVNVDHPFLFMLIYEEEGNRCVLMNGRIMNPTS